MLAGLVQGSGCLRFLSRDDKTLSNAESTLVTGRVTRGVVTRKVRASTPIFVGHKTPKVHLSREIDAYASLLSLPGERERQVGDRGDVRERHLRTLHALPGPDLGSGRLLCGGTREYKWLAWDTQQLKHTDKDPPTQTHMTQTNLWQSS